MHKSVVCIGLSPNVEDSAPVAWRCAFSEHDPFGMTPPGWQTFFDSRYFQLWSQLHPPDHCEGEAQRIIELLGLEPGDHILDAPCGYGRMSIPLAQRGLRVTGIDYSEELIERARQAAASSELRSLIHYRRADLRSATLPGPFNAAINLFSSIGYSSEADDELILRTIFAALVPGARFFLETIHRDAIVTRQARNEVVGLHGPGGLILREKSEFDPIAATISTTWMWNSPTQAGSKRLVMRVYAVNELVGLLLRAGFANIECLVGSTTKPFGPEHLGEPLGLLCRKPC